MNNACIAINNLGSLDWNLGVYDVLSGVSRLAVSVRDRANVLSIAYTMHKLNKRLEELFKQTDGILDGSIKPDPSAKPVTKEGVRTLGYTLNQMHQTIGQNLDAMTRVNLHNNSLTAGSMRKLRAYSERILDLVDWVEALQLPDHTNEVFDRAQQQRERGELFDMAQVQQQLALTIKFTATALKYLNALDKNTQKRMTEKLEAICKEPFNVRLSLPLKGNDKRKARVGDYRILFEITPTELIVADIGPRGQIYRTL